MQFYWRKPTLIKIEIPRLLPMPEIVGNQIEGGINILIYKVNLQRPSIINAMHALCLFKRL
jgi:hypothetical protein